MTEDPTLARAIETLSQREDIAFPRYDDKEATDAIILALKELDFIHRQLSSLSRAVTELQSQSIVRLRYEAQPNKDGFPGFPAE